MDTATQSSTQTDAQQQVTWPLLSLNQAHALATYIQKQAKPVLYASYHRRDVFRNYQSLEVMLSTCADTFSLVHCAALSSQHLALRYPRALADDLMDLYDLYLTFIRQMSTAALSSRHKEVFEAFVARNNIRVQPASRGQFFTSYPGIAGDFCTKAQLCIQALWTAIGYEPARRNAWLAERTILFPFTSPRINRWRSLARKQSFDELQNALYSVKPVPRKRAAAQTAVSSVTLALEPAAKPRTATESSVAEARVVEVTAEYERLPDCIRVSTLNGQLKITLSFNLLEDVSITPVELKDFLADNASFANSLGSVVLDHAGRAVGNLKVEWLAPAELFPETLQAAKNCLKALAAEKATFETALEVFTENCHLAGVLDTLNDLLSAADFAVIQRNLK
jgi:hypothetical protein